MGAKTSPEMLRARQLIEAGATAYRAAQECGLTVSGITRSKWYIAHQAQKGADAAPAVSPMDAARRLILDEGKTAYEAAKLTGVAQSSISRAAWYREHIEKK